MLGHKPQKPIAPGAIASSFENYSKHIMGALPRLVLGFALLFIGMIILGVGIMFLGVSPLKGCLYCYPGGLVGKKGGQREFHFSMKNLENKFIGSQYPIRSRNSKTS